MKKKVIAIALCLAVVIALLCGLTACKDTPSQEEPKLTVTFDLGYENRFLVPQSVENGGFAVKPNDPIRTGYQFLGWKNNGEAFSFDTAITESITLIAVWKENTVDVAEPTCKITLTIGETQEESTELAGVTLHEVLEKSSAYQTALLKQWLHRVTDREGNVIATDAIFNEDTELVLHMESPYGFRIRFSEADRVVSTAGNGFIRVRGNTPSAIREAVGENLIAEANGQEYTVGTIIGIYGDAEYQTELSDDEELAESSSDFKDIYIKMNWTVSAYALGADVRLCVMDRDEELLNAKVLGLRTIANLLNPTASSALGKSGNYTKLTYGKNNQISKMEIYRDGQPTEYMGTEDDAYYLLYQDSVLTGLNGNLNGTVRLSRSDNRFHVSYEIPDVRIRHINRVRFSQELKEGLDAYLTSEAFANSITKNSTANGMTFIYLKYLNKDYYGMAGWECDSCATAVYSEEKPSACNNKNCESQKEGGAFTCHATTLAKKALQELVLDKIETIVNASGEIDDLLWGDSSVKTQGWYGYFDFFNTWAYTYQQYNDHLLKTVEGYVEERDNPYYGYKDKIKHYLETWILLLMKDKLYEKTYTVYSVLNQWSKIGTDDEKYPRTVGEAIEKAEKMLDEVLPLYQDTEFQSTGIWLRENLCRLRMTDGESSVSLFKAKAQTLNNTIRTRVAFGYNYFQYWLMTFENLGISIPDSIAMTQYVIPYFEKTYYSLNEDGTYKESTGCNWVGWSGAPLARSILAKYSDFYNLEYEKSQQAYFPFEDKGMAQQGISAMVNFDRLYDYFNHTLTTGANVSPEYVLLTMYAHGIDPEHYTKAVETVNLDNEYNIIARWVEKLNQNQDGSVQIRGVLDMAIAICYLAQNAGVDAPSPWGEVTSDTAVIHVGSAA